MERSRAGVLTRGEPLGDIVASLHDLLDAERAAAEAASRLVLAATTPAMARLFQKLCDDEAWSCAGLGRVIRHLGGKVSPRGSVRTAGTRPVETLPPLRERLGRLNRDQARVVRQLDRILEEDLDREAGGFLRQMRSLHAENVHRCDALIASLTPRADG